MGYCTRNEVLTKMGRSNTDDPDVFENIDKSIEAATTAINNHTHRQFDNVTGYRLLPSLGGYRLDIPDLAAVDTIEIDTTDNGTFDTTVATADYELGTWRESGRIIVDDAEVDTNWPYEFVTLLNRPWPTGRRANHVKITGDWGWQSVPTPIRDAAMMLTIRYAQRMQQAPFGVQSWGELGALAIRSHDPDVAALIDDYRKVAVA